jgi:tellurite resistance protein
MQAADTVAAPAPKPAAAPSTTLSYLPVGMFGSVMGLTGLSIAWHLAHQHFGLPAWIGQAIGALALIDFVVLAIAYAVKAASGFAAVKAEFANPVAGNLFGTPLISLLLLPFVLVDYSLDLARLSWVLGAVLMTVFGWAIVIRWITVRHTGPQIAPTWIVPVVGMLDVPLAVPLLQWDGLHGVMMFGTAVGLFFALPLLTMLLTRLAMEDPLPAPLQPSLLIVLAPFAVGFSAYTTTTGTIDGFAEGLYMVMLFVLPILLGRLRHLPHCSPFKVSWWAASFPLAATAVAALKFAEHARHPATDAIAGMILAIASLIIAVFAVQTLGGVAKGRLKELS